MIKQINSFSARTQAMVLAVGFSCLLCACAPTKQAEGDASAMPTQQGYGEWGVQARNIAVDMSPGDDFYRYVNQGWLQNARIPQGLSRFSVFNELTLEAEAQIQKIVDGLSVQGSAVGTPSQQLAGLYAAYLDLQQRNTLGISMFRQQLEAIDAAADHKALAGLMGRLGYDSPLAAGVVSDPMDSSRYMVQVSQSGLGLPGRDYYLNPEAPYSEYRATYQHYLSLLLTEAGFAETEVRAQAVLAFETALAEVHWSPAARRDVLKMYHKMSYAELREFAPEFAWQQYFAAGNIPTDGDIFVATDSAVAASARIYGETALDTLKAYCASHLLNNYAGLLSQSLEEANFHLYQRTLKGIAEPRPLNIRGVQLLNAYLGEQLGKLYVERYFPAANKARMEQLVGYLKQAFRQRLTDNAWMDEATRAEAFKKLKSFNTKIGYPDQWHDYSSVHIDRHHLVQSVREVEQWMHEDALQKLREGRRDWEWYMPPQTVNAYYSPSRNEIVFPAAILQAPFFNEDADPAVNFGAIGMVIGHEMGHGFDDQGSRFDAEGNLREWWTPAARDNFNKLAEQLIKQFEAYEPLPGMPLNGKLTLGENIGDLGGLAIAYSAWQNYQRDRYQSKAPIIGGFTGDQRFFLSYAQMWRSLYTTEALRMQVLNNPHSPGEFRVNGIVTNIDGWYQAFDVTPQQALYIPPQQRVNIW